MKKQNQNKVAAAVAVLGLLALATGLFMGSARAQTITEGVDGCNFAKSTGADVLSRSLTTTSRSATELATTFQFFFEIKTGATDSVLYLHVTHMATGFTEDAAFNGGTALVNGQGQCFQFIATSGFSYNLRLGTSTTVGVIAFDRKVN